MCDHYCFGQRANEDPKASSSATDTDSDGYSDNPPSNTPAARERRLAEIDARKRVEELVAKCLCLPTPPPFCPRCVTAPNTGAITCCADGGSWFQKCRANDAEYTNELPYTYQQGRDVCAQ